MTIPVEQILEVAVLAAFFTLYILAWQAGERLRGFGRAARSTPAAAR